MSISKKQVWISTSAWRGFRQPVNACGGANNTGQFSDSPCPTHVCREEILAFRKKLKAARIKSVIMECESSNVFCSHVYVLVAPEHHTKAYEIAQEHSNETTLFYSVEKYVEKRKEAI